MRKLKIELNWNLINWNLTESILEIIALKTTILCVFKKGETFLKYSQMSTGFVKC